MLEFISYLAAKTSPYSKTPNNTATNCTAATTPYNLDKSSYHYFPDDIIITNLLLSDTNNNNNNTNNNNNILQQSTHNNNNSDLTASVTLVSINNSLGGVNKTQGDENIDVYNINPFVRFICKSFPKIGKRLLPMYPTTPQRVLAMMEGNNDSNSNNNNNKEETPYNQQNKNGDNIGNGINNDPVYLHKDPYSAEVRAEIIDENSDIGNINQSPHDKIFCKAHYSSYLLFGYVFVLFGCVSDAILWLSVSFIAALSALLSLVLGLYCFIQMNMFSTVDEIDDKYANNMIAGVLIRFFSGDDDGTIYQSQSHASRHVTTFPYLISLFLGDTFSSASYFGGITLFITAPVVIFLIFSAINNVMAFLCFGLSPCSILRQRRSNGNNSCSSVLTMAAHLLVDFNMRLVGDLRSWALHFCKVSIFSIFMFLFVKTFILNYLNAIGLSTESIEAKLSTGRFVVFEGVTSAIILLPSTIFISLKISSILATRLVGGSISYRPISREDMRKEICDYNIDENKQTNCDNTTTAIVPCQHHGGVLGPLFDPLRWHTEADAKAKNAAYDSSMETPLRTCGGQYYNDYYQHYTFCGETGKCINHGSEKNDFAVGKTVNGNNGIQKYSDENRNRALIQERTESHLVQDIAEGMTATQSAMAVSVVTSLITIIVLLIRVMFMWSRSPLKSSSYYPFSYPPGFSKDNESIEISTLQSIATSIIELVWWFGPSLGIIFISIIFTIAVVGLIFFVVMLRKNATSVSQTDISVCASVANDNTDGKQKGGKTDLDKNTKGQKDELSVSHVSRFSRYVSYWLWYMAMKIDMDTPHYLPSYPVETLENSFFIIRNSSVIKITKITRVVCLILKYAVATMAIRYIVVIPVLPLLFTYNGIFDTITPLTNITSTTLQEVTFYTSTSAAFACFAIIITIIMIWLLFLSVINFSLEIAYNIFVKIPFTNVVIIGTVAEILRLTNTPLFRPMRHGFSDGVYDLCHKGHKRQLLHCYKNCDRVFSGVLNDEDCEVYKKLPIMTLFQRCEEVVRCQGVYRVIPSSPPAGIPLEFLAYYGITIVVFGEEYNFPEDKYYKIPRDLKITTTAPRTGGISTSDLIREIQSRKKK